MDILPVSLYEYLALFLLCFVSFLIGWFLRGKKRHTAAVADDKPSGTTIDISVPGKMVRAVQTRKRGGEAVAGADFRRLQHTYDPLPPEAFEDVEPTDDPSKKTSAVRDDLKRINGIGPAIEKKLNKIGIYTLLQISNFTREDIENVAKRLESFPKKIEKEQWVEQARALLNDPSEYE
ncbi:MAG: hypothetical protein KDD04_00910 [Sinomicrobium sp.]|nr:hypothetical protein [Sinomicrobium sp.]